VKATYHRLAEFKPLRLHFDEVLNNPQDEMADRLAEQVELKVVIEPPKVEGQRYSAQVIMNLPVVLPKEGMPFPSEEKPCATVFSSTL